MTVTGDEEPLLYHRAMPGPGGTALWLAASLLFWLVVPAALGQRRLRRADL